MKKLMAVLLALTLCLSSVAFAGNYTYQATQNFCELLDAYNIYYDVYEVDDNNDEKVTVTYTDEKLGDITVRIFFSQNGTVSYRVWNVVDFSCGVSYAYQICNGLNYDWKYAKFYVDTSDNSVTVANDMELTDGANCGDACVEMLVDIISILEAAADDLLKLK